MTRWRVGIDVGGTFTDLVLASDDESRLAVLKVLTTPRDPSEALVEGLRTLLGRASVAADAVGYVGHGTTVCLNAVLEGTGARTGLLTTRGLRDLLELRRQTRDQLYDLQAAKPVPLVPRRRRLEVPERMAFDGTVLQPVDLAAAERALVALQGEAIEALAIGFLHAYANPAHEAAVRARVARLAPELFVSVSSEILPEFREYERLSTTVLNAYVGPLMHRYLSRLETRLAPLALPVPPHILLSNGGIATLAYARQRPVFTMASGPSAGVTGAVVVARAAGAERVVTFDMGGTSTDVCLIERGVPATASEKRYRGHPVKGVMLDVESIGAGGGSIAWVDGGGFLRVGPRSAGADPGPACYARGGVQPTVTDANLVLGRLGATGLLGGALPLDVRRAETAVGDQIARPLGRSLHEAAADVVAVVNASMAAAIRLAAVARGVDPRILTLVAFGGAGPMHASAVAREVGIRRVLVPAQPGVLCALGLVVADLRADFARTHLARMDTVDATALESTFRALEDEARRWAAASGVSARDVVLTRSADMRHVRQNYELPVPVPPRLGPVSVGPLVASFHRVHRRVYGISAPDAPTEIVTARVSGCLPVAPPRLDAPPVASSMDDARRSERPLFLGARGVVPCPVFDRARLPRGARLVGPAILEQLDGTTVVEPGDHAEIDPTGNLLITVPP